MKIRIYKLLLTIILSTSIALSQSLLPVLGGQKVATSILSFLKIDPSTASMGMGHAYVAVGGDASVIHWNPAALVQLGTTSFSFSHKEYYTGIQYDYFASAFSLNKNSSLGLAAGILHMSPMEITTEYKPYGSGEYFSFKDYYISLAWSQKMSDRFSFGVTTKYVQEDYLDLSTSLLLIDIGTFYWTGYKDLRIAVSLLNFGSPISPDGSYISTDLDGESYEKSYEDYSPPTSFQLGAALTVYKTDFISVLGSIQLIHPVDNAEQYIMATEVRLLNALMLRFGYDITEKTSPFSFGAGFRSSKWKQGFSIEYAYKYHPYLMEQQQFQLNFNF